MIPKSTLAAGGRFVVVAAGSTNGKKGESDRLQVLVNAASHQGSTTQRIEVIGSERLAEWCNQNPAVAKRWAGTSPGLLTLAEWVQTEAHQVRWQATDSLVEEISQLRSNLEFGTGSVRHLHIQGPPGVGKTRLALELCRESAWSAFVVYVRQASDIQLVELIDDAVRQQAVRLVVVADEVQPEQLLPLRDAVGRGDGRIRLVTVGHCATPDPTQIPAFKVGPVAREISAKIVKGWYGSMPVEQVEFVVRFADGYVRLAKLTADAVARYSSLDVSALLNRDEVRMLLDGMLGTGARRSLHVVAVLGSVGWTEDLRAEGEAIARHFDLDWNEVRAEVELFEKRFGIAPRSGRYRYISPTPLGIHLAVEAWTMFPELLTSLPDVLPTEKAKDAYYERLRSIASAPQARAYAREDLASFSVIGDFVDPQQIRRWSALSAAEPGRAAAGILRALEAADPEGRLRVADLARREAVGTLSRLAWPSKSFYDATKALALLAEAENESWGNNATGEFVARFQVRLGGTAVPYLDRLPLVDELVETGRTPLVRLAVKALAGASNRHESRMVGETASDAVPEPEWHPSSEQELQACVLAALEFLTKIANRGAEGYQDELVSASVSFSPMLRNRDVRSSVIAFFEATRASYPEVRESLRRTIGDIVDRERRIWRELPEADVAELESLHESFESGSLEARLQQLVGHIRWGRDSQPNLTSLAIEFVEAPNRLVNVLPWLMSGSAEDGLRFGNVLAAEDSELELLAGLSVDAGSDARVFCGYLQTIRQRQGDGWYDGWVEVLSDREPRPVRLIFEVASRCGVTDRVARTLLAMLESEPVPPATVGQLGFGSWGEGLDAECFADLLRAIVDSGHEATALSILLRRIESNPSELDGRSGIALELLTSSALIRSDNHTNYCWKELALRYVDKYPGEIAAGIFRAHEDGSTGIWFVEHSYATDLLDACLDRNAKGVWGGLQQQLSSSSADAFAIGFPRGVVDRCPADQVLAWVDGDPVPRAKMVAALADKSFITDDTLAARTVEGYGDLEGVYDAFFAAWVSDSWSGPASAHWERQAETLEAVAARTGLPKLRQWAAGTVRELLEMARRDRAREDEEELRGW